MARSSPPSNARRRSTSSRPTTPIVATRPTRTPGSIASIPKPERSSRSSRAAWALQSASPMTLRSTGRATCTSPTLELGLIWKFDHAGRGSVWSDDPLLGWTEQSGTWNSRYGTPAGYLGINTVALSPDGRYLYGGTGGGPGGPTGSGLLVRIPIPPDSSAGKADLFASGLGCNDGLAVVPDGTIYFADSCNSDVWAFSPDGARRQLIASR